MSGIFEVESTTSLTTKCKTLRTWMLEAMPDELIEAECQKLERALDFDEAVRIWVAKLYDQQDTANRWIEEKQRRIEEIRKRGEELESLLKEVLVDLPLEYFDRAKTLLGIAPDEGPERPVGADDAFRDAMLNAAESIKLANTSDIAALYIAMMNAIARKQHAEAVEKGLELGKSSLLILEELKGTTP